jgi:hypothetical protein
MKKIWILVILVVAIGTILGLTIFLRHEEGEKGVNLKTVKLAEIKKIRDEIKTEVEEAIVKYQEESFYSENDFSLILENQDEFKSQLIRKFKQSLVRVSAENFEFNLEQSKKSVILKCDIKGARYSTNSYNMHFLLGKWPFDLYKFKEYKKKLVYEGKIEGVPTKIVFEFPYVLSHCHEHVWPR